jgi:5-methylcytosine-specific restriction enzyme subunit McrC
VTDSERVALGVVECQEQGAVEVPLAEVLNESGDLAVLAEVQNKGYFTVRYQGQRVRLVAGSHVGLIPLTKNLAIFVKPRAPVSPNLTHVVSKSGASAVSLPILRMYESHSEWNASVGLILAEALASASERILHQGFLRRYEAREAVSAMPRGRVIIDTRLLRQRSRGMTYQVPVRWYEQTGDLPENHCIKDALRIAIRSVPQGREGLALRRRLNACFRGFQHVGDDPKRRYMASPLVANPMSIPSSRDAYRDALTYARTIIERQSVSHDAGHRVRLPSLVLDMGDVFEGYVRNVLRSASTQDLTPYITQDGNTEGKRRLFQDSVDNRYATPDVVLLDREGWVQVVIEVKNVLGGSGDKMRSFIEQATTYGLCYGVKDVVIVQPRSAASHHGLQTFGRIGDIWVHTYRVDLAATDLQAEEDGFASSVGGVLRAAVERQSVT